MERTTVSLQPSEAGVAQAAAVIYAAYLSSNRVPTGSEEEWMRRAVREALYIARHADDLIRSDGEMG